MSIDKKKMLKKYTKELCHCYLLTYFASFNLPSNNYDPSHIFIWL